MKKRIAAALIAVLLCTSPLVALFGIDFGGGGDIVFDPSVYGQAVLVVSQLVKSYEELKALLDLQTWLAKVVPVNMSLRYQTIGTAWYGLSLPYDRFGNLSAWLQAVNQGGAAVSGYSSASVPLHPYGPKVSGLAPDELSKAASFYAAAELADGTNIHSMETVGMLRGNATAVERSIENLTNDSLSLDPAMNTEIAVLNKINAASVAGLRMTRDTNRALLSVLEQQIVRSKRERDAQASEINAQIVRLERGDEAKAENTATITQSLQSFRWR